MIFNPNGFIFQDDSGMFEAKLLYEWYQPTSLLWWSVPPIGDGVLADGRPRGKVNTLVSAEVRRADRLRNQCKRKGSPSGGVRRWGDARKIPMTFCAAEENGKPTSRRKFKVCTAPKTKGVSTSARKSICIYPSIYLSICLSICFVGAATFRKMRWVGVRVLLSDCTPSCRWF